jgi:methionine-gamma-lyase
MKSMVNLGMDTLCVHSGIGEDEFGSVVPPIYQTSTFKFKNSEHGARLFKGEEDGYIYTRMRNPTVEAMEKSVAALECGAKALGCGSGMAAVSTLFLATLKAGDHIICSDSVYGPTTSILANYFVNYKIESTFVDASNLEIVKNAVKPNTKMIFVETPGNPNLAVCDIQALADLAHANGAKLAVDNTFMSPILQKPFQFGADYIIHSMTKYINGHADVVAGIIVVKNEEEYPAFRKTLNHFGGVIDPFNSFLVHRGIKTLALRMERVCENAQKVAEFLENHPKIEWVRFPTLKSHPGFEIHKKQSLYGGGGVIAFELKGGIDAGVKLMDNIELWQLAVSLGGVESLIQHPATMTHASMGKALREQAQITDGLVRISVGIENIEDLISTLEKGLEHC